MVLIVLGISESSQLEMGSFCDFSACDVQYVYDLSIGYENSQIKVIIKSITATIIVICSRYIVYYNAFSLLIDYFELKKKLK